MKRFSPTVPHPLVLIVALICVCASPDTQGALRDADSPFDAGLSLSPHHRSVPGLPADEWGQPPAREEDDERVQRTMRRIERLMGEQRYVQALVELEAELGDREHHPDLLGLAARLAIHAGRLDRADVYLARLTELDPEFPRVRPIWGTVLLHMGEFAKAEAVLLEALEREPDDPETRFHLVCLYAATRRLDHGMRLLQRVGAADLAIMAGGMGKDFDELVRLLKDDIYLEVGRTLMRGGVPRDERARAPVASPEDSDMLLLSVNGLSADALFAAPVEESPTSAEEMRSLMKRVSALFARIGVLLLDEQWADAARVGKQPQVVRLGLTAPAYEAFVDYARFRAGEDEGFHDLARLSARFPDLLTVSLLHASALMDRSRHGEAISVLNQVQRQHPRHPVAILLAFRSLQERARRTESFAVLDELDESLLNFRAGWFMADDQYRLAVRAAAAQNDIVNRYLEIVISEGVREADRLGREEDWETADRIATRVLRWAPDDDRAGFHAGRAAMAVRDVARAAEYFEALARRNPDNAYAYTLWGGALLRARRHEDAARVLDQALAANPRDLGARFNRALVEAARGNVSGALPHLQALQIVEYGQTLAWLAQEVALLSDLIPADAFRALAAYVVFGGHDPEGMTGDSRSRETSPQSWIDWAGIEARTNDEWRAYLGEIALAIRAYLDAARANDWDGAKEALRLAQLRGGRSPVLEVERHRIRVRRGGHEATAESMQAHVAQYPGDATLRARYGFMLVEEEYFESAIPFFVDALAIRSDDGDSLFGLACAHAGRGDEEESRAIIRRMEQEMPEDLARWMASQQPFVQRVAHYIAPAPANAAAP